MPHKAHAAMSASGVPGVESPVLARPASHGLRGHEHVPQRPATSMVAPVFMPLILSEAGVQQIHLPALLRGLEIDAIDFQTPDTLISHRDAIAVVRRALQCQPLAERGLEAGRRAYRRWTAHPPSRLRAVPTGALPDVPQSEGWGALA